MSEQNHAPAPHDENQLIAERRDKLRALREAHAQGAGVTFPTISSRRTTLPRCRTSTPARTHNRLKPTLFM